MAAVADEAENYEMSEYVPGEVLVKFKEGADPQTVLKEINLEVKDISRIHSIKPAVAKFKKDYKLEKNSGGWYSFLGKNYKEVNEIPDEEMFKKAYQNMPETEKSLYRSYKIRLPEDADVKEVIDRLKGDPDVEYAEPNYIVKTNMVPDDPYYSTSGSWGQSYDDLWGLKKIQCEQAWDISQGEGAVVAVIDTGVDYNHPDIWNNIWVNPLMMQDTNSDGKIDLNDCDTNADHIISPGEIITDPETGEFMFGWNAVNNSGNPMDDNGHGTHVAGSIAAIGNNNVGVIGIAPKAKIMMVKGLDNSGSGYVSDLSFCVKYAADRGADILSNSWGGEFYSQALTDAFHYAYYVKGSICLAAAGNSNKDVIFFSPASIDVVMAVSSVDHNDQKSDFSNYGNKIDVAAPGGDSATEDGPDGPETYRLSRNILSLRAAGTDMYGYWDVLFGLPAGICLVPQFNQSALYYRSKGTSMACPYAAGVAALIIGNNGALTKEEIRKALLISAEDVGGNGFDPHFGYGRVNALFALNPSLHVYRIARIQSPEPNRQFGGPVSIKGIALARDFTHYTIEVGSGNNPLAWSSNGVVLADGGNNQVFESLLGSWDHSSYSSGVYTIRLRVFTSDDAVAEVKVPVVINQSIKPGWPQYTDGFFRNNVVTADIDKDGDTEIIASTLDGNLYIWHHDGTPLEGWPVFVSDSLATPSVGDLDGDGYPEIVAGGSGGLFILSHDGTFWANGWPKRAYTDEMSFVSSSATLFDIDGDGDLEIFVGNEKWQMCAWHHTGEMLQGWPVRIQHNQSVTSPAIADIDCDGEPEIIAIEKGTSDIKGNLYAWNADGTPVAGQWPVDLGGGSLRPAIGDVDGDERMEVVVNTQKGLFVIRGDGTVQPGWPKVSGNEQLPALGYGQLALGDLDKDGKADIVFGARTSYTFLSPHIWVFKGDGSLFEGWNWPYQFGSRADVRGALIADIDDDTEQEIIAVVSGPDDDDIYGTPYLYVFNRDGTPFEGYRKQMDVDSLSLPAVCNIDGEADGNRLEIISGTSRGGINAPFYVYDFEGSVAGGKMDWPMFAHDAQKTGLYKGENKPPVLNIIGGKVISEGHRLNFRITAYDPNSDNLVYTAENLPQGATLVRNNFEWKPNYTQAGTYEVTFTVSDGQVQDSETIAIQVSDEAFPAPSNIVATAIAAEEILITWTDNSDSEDGFIIERSTDSADSFVEIHRTIANISEYRDTDVDDGVTYYYRVCAYNSGGESERLETASATTPILAPSDISAVTAGTNSINISWRDNSSHEQGFKIERSMSESGPFTEVGGVGANATIFGNTVMADGITYYYRVRAYNGANFSPYSDVIQCYLPLLPCYITAAKSQTSALITLTISDNADGKTGFKIERSLNQTEGFTEIADVAAGTTLYYDGGLQDGTTYYYRARAYNALENGPYSQTASATTRFAAPSGLRASVIASWRIDLSWLDNTNSETGFALERSLNGTTFTLVANLPANSTAYQDESLSASTKYYYRVRAYKDTLNSSYSNTASGTTLPPPAAPTNLAASAVSATQINLTWQDNSGNEEGFKIERRSDFNPSQYIQIAVVGPDVITYSHAGLIPNKTYYYRVCAYDRGGKSSYSNVANATTPINQPPIITIDPPGDKVIGENQALTFTVYIADPDIGDTAELLPVSLPEGATLTPESAGIIFTWTPTFSQAGVYPLTFTVSDGDLTASASIKITVNNVNRPPEITPIGNKQINEGQVLEFQAVVIDPDNDALDISIQPLPAGATVSRVVDGETETGTVIFRWTPTYEQAGAYDITFSATDLVAGGEGYTVSETITITVNNVNRPPAIGSIPAQQIREGEPFTLQLNAQDPDGDTLFYVFNSWDISMRGLELSEEGLLTWTPGFDQAGDYPIDINISDILSHTNNPRESFKISCRFTIEVVNVNRPPYIDPIDNQEINENQPLTIIVTATDPDGDSLTYSAWDLPAGSTFDPETRTFTWTPTYEQAGYYKVFFGASDGDLSMNVGIPITVNNVNRAPYIEPVPDQVIKEGEQWSFQLKAVDPDGDKLKFWFNTVPDIKGLTLSDDGLLSWAPDFNQDGAYVLDLVVSDIPDHPEDYLKTYFNVKITVLSVNNHPEILYLRNYNNIYIMWRGYDKEDRYNLTYSYKVDEGTWSEPTRITRIDVKQLSQNLQPGKHIFHVKAIDTKGAESKPKSVEFTVMANTPPKMQYLNNVRNIYLIWLGYDKEDGYNLTYSYRIDGGKWSVPSTTRYIYIRNINVPKGKHLFEVKAIDKKGLESEVKSNVFIK